MKVYGFYFCFVCAINLFTLAEFKVTNYNMKNSLENFRSHEVEYFKEEDEGRNNVTNNENGEDVTLYIGFASNPFGASSRFIPKKNTTVKTRAPGAGSEENAVDTGQADTGPALTHDEPRAKRGVLHLYNMIKCATGCNPLGYKGYGCFCGFLGSGHPVDGIDKCCKRHDWCYDRAGCPPFFEYLVPYVWKCYRNRPLCAIEQGGWSTTSSCAKRLCECDRILAECLSRYPCPGSRALCHSSPWRLLQNAFMII